MSKSTHGEPAQTTQSAIDHDHAAGISRRTVLAGAAATAAAVTIGADTPAVAQSADSKQDMETFVTLSAALTVIAPKLLAPETDSVGIKHDYFSWVNTKQPVAFARLLQITKTAAIQNPAGDGADSIIKQADVDRLVQAMESNADTKFLVRSIVLMWYLGSWYEPADLKALAGSSPPSFIGHTVISPKAYTQGWLWHVAQAHPMGYSDMQFGYWTRKPAPIEDFITSRSKGKT